MLGQVCEDNAPGCVDTIHHTLVGTVFHRRLNNAFLGKQCCQAARPHQCTQMKPVASMRPQFRLRRARSYHKGQ